jgi:CspA family cold shock protein
LLLRAKVKWFDAQKGYGFLRREGEPDVFVHYSAILEEGYRTLNDGEEVEYELVETERGPQARSVKRLQKTETADQGQ